MKKYVIALDEGTTSARTIIFDRECKTLAKAQKEFALSYPRPGWVELNPNEVFAAQYATMTEAIFGSISPSEIAAIGITNQRETTVIWNRETSKPVYPAIVWQDKRTSSFCEELKKKGYGDTFKDKTGLVIDSYFSATKIKWILDNVEGAREAAERGELAFGTIDTWLLWRLTGGKTHVTDRTNASRTMLYNIHTLEWDEELLSILGIPRSLLPEVRSSGEVYATVDVLGEKIPVSGIAGDQQASLFGQKCFDSGDAKNTYGTGCFLLMNTGGTPFSSRSGLLTTVAASEKDAGVAYALEGSVFVGGAIIQWLRDSLGLIRESKDSEYFAKKVQSSEGVYVVPAFAGLGAPYWDMYARGAILGMTRGTDRNHIIRAALESIAYQTEDVISAMESDIGKKISVLMAAGGASANVFLMQFQSDISDVSVICGTGEATALGAAFLAGLAVGFWQDRNELTKLYESKRVFGPRITQEERQKLISGWKTAVSHVLSEKKED